MSGAPWWEEFRADPAPDDPAAPPAPARSSPAPERSAVGSRAVRPPRRPERGERALKVLAAVLGLVLVALVGVLGVRVLSPSGNASAADAATTDPATPPAPSSGTPSSGTPSSGTPSSGSPATTADASPGGTAAADARARAELEALRDAGLAAHPPQGQWVAQLAAKSVGTTDPVQTAANGSSTFYAGDILAQSRAIASGIAGGDVFVLRSTDVGERSVDARGNPYWVTFAAGPFADVDDVRTWCDSVFAATPAPERRNVCLPEQLLAPR